jgi:hypothetical protein
MKKTDNINHPYPDKGDLGSYSTFSSLAQSLDEADYASRTSRNLSVIGGGTVNLTAGGSVEWTKDFVFKDNISGNIQTLPASESPVQLDKGDVAYVNLVRGPTKNIELDIHTSSGAIPNTNKAQALFARINDNLWVYGRGTIDIGDISVEGDVSTVFIPVSLNEERGGGTYTIGRRRLNLADTNVPVDSRVFDFTVEAQTILSGNEGTVELYDVTNPSNEILKASFTVNTNQPSEYVSTISPESDNTKRVYEIRSGLDEGGGPYSDTEKLLVWHATFEVKAQ